MNRLLIVLGILLVFVLIYQWRDYGGALATRGAAVNGIEVPADSEEGAVPANRLAPLARFDEIVQRPLFIEGRRPPPEVDASAEEEKPKPPPPVKTRPAMILTAVLMVDNQKKAVFRTIDKKQPFQNLTLGEEINGWVVADIQSSQVKLTQGRTEEIFLLRQYEKVPLPVIPDKAPVQKVEQKVEQKAAVSKSDTDEAARPGTK